MRKLSLLAVGLLTTATLSGCADPFAEASLEISVTGSPNIVGEPVEIAVSVSGVEAEKLVVVQEQIDGGEWSDLGTLNLAADVLSGAVSDTMNDAESVAYRALLLPSEGAEAVEESAAANFSPVTLEDYVQQNLTLSLELTDKPDESPYLFDGDSAGVTVGFELQGGSGLEPSAVLRLSTGEELARLSDLGTQNVIWDVSSDAADGEAVMLELEATVRGTNGSTTATETLEVRVTNPVAAYEALASQINENRSISFRRDLLAQVAGGIFLDQSSKSWVDGASVNFIFDEPYMGALTKFEPVMRYQVPQSCAPSGEADVRSLPGRPFVIESELAGYNFDETTFGYFDGEKVYFSSAWKMCLG